MTLLVGIKCSDGFVIGADSAVTDGDIVYGDAKLHWHRGSADKPYRLVVACGGDIATANVVRERIRDKVATLEHPTLEQIKKIVERAVYAVWNRHVLPYLREDMAHHAVPAAFEIIVGISVGNDFAVQISKRETVTEVNTYAFHGSGVNFANVARTTLLESPGNVLALPYPTAVAAHLAIELFRIAKLYGSGVGLDTEIIAWRSNDSPYTFTMPRPNQPPNSDLGSIQENLKMAIWAAYEKCNVSPVMFEANISNVVNLLKQIRAGTEAQGHWDARIVRYWFSRTADAWRMGDLDPNQGITVSFPTEPEQPP